MPKLHSWISDEERSRMGLHYRIDCMADSAHAEIRAMVGNARKGYETPDRGPLTDAMEIIASYLQGLANVPDAMRQQADYLQLAACQNAFQQREGRSVSLIGNIFGV